MSHAPGTGTFCERRDILSNMQRTLAFSGALLFAAGLFTGVWSAAALAGFVVIAIPRLALVPHLAAITGGLWLITTSYTLPMLHYDDKQKWRLGWASIIPAWGNWLIPLAASVLGVNGLQYTESLPNNIIAFLLQVFVVPPSLFAGVYWVRGFLCASK